MASIAKVRGATRRTNGRQLSRKASPSDVRLKLVVMSAIDAGLRKRYLTLLEAARAANVDRATLSRIRHGDHRRISIASLFDVSDRLGLRIKIDVQLVQ